MHDKLCVCLGSSPHLFDRSACIDMHVCILNTCRNPDKRESASGPWGDGRTSVEPDAEALLMPQLVHLVICSVQTGNTVPADSLGARLCFTVLLHPIISQRAPQGPLSDRLTLVLWLPFPLPCPAHTCTDPFAYSLQQGLVHCLTACCSFLIPSLRFSFWSCLPCAGEQPQFLFLPLSPSILSLTSGCPQRPHEACVSLILPTHMPVGQFLQPG